MKLFCAYFEYLQASCMHVHNQSHVKIQQKTPFVDSKKCGEKLNRLILKNVERN